MSNEIRVMEKKGLGKAKNQGGQYDTIDKCVQDLSEWCQSSC